MQRSKRINRSKKKRHPHSWSKESSWGVHRTANSWKVVTKTTYEGSQRDRPPASSWWRSLPWRTVLKWGSGLVLSLIPGNVF